MTDVSKIRILIAEDNDVSREMMATILRTKGYQTIEARDGGEAIEIVKREDVHMALVDLNMEPRGGFDFVRFLRTEDIDLPVVIVTGDQSTDVLSQASTLGVPRLLQKPVQPERLLHTIEQILRRYKIVDAITIEGQKRDGFEPEELMHKTIELAEENAKSGKGRPFGAIVASKDGHILGQGVNGKRSRCDPTAHAEVMAIRQAAEALNSDDLSACVLYVSSEPTMMGKALIISVGIETVYYGLSHREVQSLRGDEQVVRVQLGDGPNVKTEFQPLCSEDVRKMLQQFAA